MWSSRPRSQHLRCQQTIVLPRGSDRMPRPVAGSRAALFWKQCRHAASSPMLERLSCCFCSASQFSTVLHTSRLQPHFRTEEPSLPPSIFAEDLARDELPQVLVCPNFNCESSLGPSRHMQSRGCTHAGRSGNAHDAHAAP